jgi:signal transduction histidine kinase
MTCAIEHITLPQRPLDSMSVRPMLYEFITAHADEIIAVTRGRLTGRPWPSVSKGELDQGVPLFLAQLSETLRLEATDTPFASGTIGATAAKHGADLLAEGFNVTQVVQGYGDICQAVTEVAVACAVPISVEEFHTLNRCLDTAIAEAVTEHTRLSTLRRTAEDVELLGQTAHDLRDLLNTALLSFHALKRGAVAVNGSTAAVLERSLTGLRSLVDRMLSEARLASGQQIRERLMVSSLINEAAAAGILHSEDRGIHFRVDPVDAGLAVNADVQLLASAVMNLLHNAFKYTAAGGTVTLRANAVGGRMLLEIEDECGGIPASKGDPFQKFGDRRGHDRSGLGLGLSIARQAVRAHDGDITVRNMPGKGCVFSIDLPLMSSPSTL